jgi:hypothetical protein
VSFFLHSLFLILFPLRTLPPSLPSPLRLVMRLGEETGRDLIADLSRTQQLVEVLEVGHIISGKFER